MRSQLGEAALAIGYPSSVVYLSVQCTSKCFQLICTSFTVVESLKAVDIGIEGMVDYCINRGVGLVLVRSRN